MHMINLSFKRETFSISTLRFAETVRCCRCIHSSFLRCCERRLDYLLAEGHPFHSQQQSCDLLPRAFCAIDIMFTDSKRGAGWDPRRQWRHAMVHSETVISGNCIFWSNNLGFEQIIVWSKFGSWSKLCRACSRLYRSRLLELNTHIEPLFEIYTPYLLLHRLKVNSFVKIVNLFVTQFTNTIQYLF